MYNVYQILISRELTDEINQSDDPLRILEFKAYLDASTFSDTAAGISNKLYKKVAEINANNLEEVFAAGNNGSTSLIKLHPEMRSISTGDIIVDDDNRAVVVDMFGFKDIEFAA